MNVDTITALDFHIFLLRASEIRTQDTFCSPLLYMGADKSLARQRRKQTNVSVRMA